MKKIKIHLVFHIYNPAIPYITLNTLQMIFNKIEELLLNYRTQHTTR